MVSHRYQCVRRATWRAADKQKHEYYKLGAATYGKTVKNGLSLEPTLSVHNGNEPGAQEALTGLSKLLKIA